MSNKISSGEKKSYKYFTGYLNDDYKVNSLDVMLPKVRIYVRIYDGQTDWRSWLVWKM